jgi:hypothetical protein
VSAPRELDPGRVLVLARFAGRGKTSGLELGKLGQVATVFHLNAGKLTRLPSYSKVEDAYTDLGLAPEGEEA